MSDPALESDDILSFYKASGSPDCSLMREVIDHAIVLGVPPSSIRYGVFQKSIRGALADSNGQTAYFTSLANGKLRVIKATDASQTFEAQRLLRSLPDGLDLRKTASHDDPDQDQDEDDKNDGKADMVEMPPASRPEAQEVATQNNQIPEVHPGSTTAQTPEQPRSSERWHGSQEEAIQRSLQEDAKTANPWDTAKLMQSWGQQLQKSAPRVGTLQTAQQYLQERKQATQTLREKLNKLAAKIGQG